jgi:hypothetical protein
MRDDLDGHGPDPPHHVGVPSAKAREKIRKRLVIATTSMAVMVVLFLLAPVQAEDSTSFAARYAGVPLISAYLCVYILAFAWMQGEVVYLCLRTIRIGGRVWLRRGLRATAGGAVLGLVYCVVRASDVVAATTGMGNPVRWEDIARLAVGIGVLLPPIGWTMPSWGPRFTAIWAWAEDAWVYWRIYPLWSLLYGTFAAKDLDPLQGLSARIALRDLREWRLPRRLVLIWDSMLELRPYRDPELEQAAADGGDGTRRALDQRAAAEAAIVLAALAAYHRNQRQSGALPLGGTGTAASPGTATSQQLSGELDWLIALARALKRHPREVVEVTRMAQPSAPG